MSEPERFRRNHLPGWGSGALLRSTAVLLVLTFALAAGTLFRTQTAAHAFAPAAVAVVAPTVARTVVVPVAKAACGTACRAAIGTAVSATASLVCGFAPGVCRLPWGQNPDVPANSDQPPPPNLNWTPSNLVSIRMSNGTYRDFTILNPTMTAGSQTVPAGWRVSWSPAAPASPYGSGTIELECRTTSTGALTHIGIASGAIFYGTDHYLVDSVRDCGAGKVATGGIKVVGAQNPSSTTAPTVRLTSDPAFRPAVGDPDRTGQGYKKCSNGTSTRLVAGKVTTYKESQGVREVELPACPTDFPTPAGAGVAAGSPWTPDTVQPAGTPTGTPLAPPLDPPSPDILPLQPKPGEPVVPRRTMPGTPAQPLPDIDPLTGTPKPTPQPLPPVVPDEGHCMWGGYAVAAEDCDGAPAPAPPPSPTPTAPGEPAPFPTSGPNPRPPDPSLPAGPSADQDTEGCLAKTWSWNPVSWVYAPVKCALLWAFVPKPGFVEGKMGEVQAEWGSTGPGRYLGAIGGVVVGVADLADKAGGCSGPAVRFDSGFLKTTLRPLAACPGDLAHTASKVVRVIATVGLYLGAAALAARVLASSLGLQLPGFGRGDDGA